MTTKRADSNEALPDSSGHLLVPGEVSAFVCQLTTIAMRTLRNLHHSIPLYLRIPTHPVPKLSDHWLQGYPFFCTWVPRASTFKLLATECYRHANTSRPIPFNSPRRADSNETLPDSAGHLPPEISAFNILLTWIAMQTLRNLYHSIPLDRRIPTHTVPMLSDHWLNGYAYLCTWVPRASTFKLLATGCYRHADALGPIPFDSPRLADSNETLPDSGGHLPAEVSPSFSLLTPIALRMPRNIHYSIPLDWRIPTHPVPKLSDPWLKGYLNICTWVPHASTFKLLATERYSHGDTSRPIPVNSPHRAEFNALCLDTVWPLVEGLSILLYFSSQGINF